MPIMLLEGFSQQGLFGRRLTTWVTSATASGWSWNTLATHGTITLSSLSLGCPHTACFAISTHEDTQPARSTRPVVHQTQNTGWQPPYGSHQQQSGYRRRYLSPLRLPRRSLQVLDPSYLPPTKVWQIVLVITQMQRGRVESTMTISLPTKLPLALLIAVTPSCKHVRM